MTDPVYNVLDELSTRRYYASGQVSALSPQSAADSTLKSGEQPTTLVDAVSPSLQELDQWSTDKYYADRSRMQRGRVQVAGRPQGHTPTSDSVNHRQSYGTMVHYVAEATDVTSAINAAVVSVRDGLDRVIVEVSRAELLGKVRTSLDLLIAREVITEDQGRNIVIRCTPKPIQAPALVNPVTSTRTAKPIPALPGNDLSLDAILNAPTIPAKLQQPLPEDPADFLKQPELEEQLPTAPLKVQELGSAGELLNDEDNDFLATQPVVEKTPEPKRKKK